MLIIGNKNHIQAPEVDEHLAYSVNEESYLVDSIDDVIVLVNDNRNKDTMLVGFFYNKDLDVLLELCKKVYWVSEFSDVPEYFITTQERKTKSLLEQAVELLPEDIGVLPHVKQVMKDATNYYNFKDSFHMNYLDFDKNFIDMLASKCYTKGDIHLLYELDPKLKLPIAYSIVEDKEKAIVAIGSQTRSDNDMISFYIKGYDVEELANKFGAKYVEGVNTFSIFIPSFIASVGDSLSKYLGEQYV